MNRPQGSDAGNNSPIWKLRVATRLRYGSRRPDPPEASLGGPIQSASMGWQRAVIPAGRPGANRSLHDAGSAASRDTAVVLAAALSLEQAPAWL
jgi:hypothetical protein